MKTETKMKMKMKTEKMKRLDGKEWG